MGVKAGMGLFVAKRKGMQCEGSSQCVCTYILFFLPLKSEIFCVPFPYVKATQHRQVPWHCNAKRHVCKFVYILLYVLSVTCQTHVCPGQVSVVLRVL